VLQGHLDMVCQKNNDTNFDFDSQGIDMYVDGDWVRARGTTLGADNGLGVAMMMAILESKEIKHPAIDALFTIDEETGMTGALNLKGGILKGEILLNMDTEEDNEIGTPPLDGIGDGPTDLKHGTMDEPDDCDMEVKHLNFDDDDDHFDFEIELNPEDFESDVEIFSINESVNKTLDMFRRMR
jgi:dipeptidase D